jgi:hypothetical protein
MRVKKGQLRRWNQHFEVLGDRTFLTVRARIIRGRDRRHEIGHDNPHRGEIFWMILEDGILVEDVSQMDIHAYSELIE